MSLAFRWPSQNMMRPILVTFKTKLNEKLLVLTDGVDPALMEPIQLHEISLGDVAPDVQIARLEALSEERVCLDIYFKYCGNALVTITTRLQLNKLYQREAYRDFSTMGRGILSRKSMDLPLMFTVHSIDVEGTVTIDLRPKDKKLIVRLHDNPVRSMGFSNNFEPDVSMLGDLLNNMARNGLRKAMDDIAGKPLHIDLPEGTSGDGDSSKKTTSEKNVETGSLASTSSTV